MKTKPTLELGNWIRCGDINAIVSSISDEDNQIEIIIIDDRDRAIYFDVFWNGEDWQSVHGDADGGYADNCDRLSDYVRKLRMGRKYS